MSVNVTNLINQVNDPATRKALHHIFKQLKADMEANKKVFDDHVHNYDSSTSSEDQLTSKPDLDNSDPSGSVTVETAATFDQNLK